MFRKRGTATITENMETAMPITPTEARPAQKAAQDVVLGEGPALFADIDKQLGERSFARVLLRDYSFTAQAAALEAYQAAGWLVEFGCPVFAPKDEAFMSISPSPMVAPNTDVTA